MKDSKIVFEKILNYIEKIKSYIKGVSYESFVLDEQKVFACSFALSQISELTQKISDEEKKRHKNIPWSAIRGLRNHIIHNYEKIDLEILWNTITKDLPTLVSNIEKIISA